MGRFWRASSRNVITWKILSGGQSALLDYEWRKLNFFSNKGILNKLINLLE